MICIRFRTPCYFKRVPPVRTGLLCAASFQIRAWRLPVRTKATRGTCCSAVDGQGSASSSASSAVAAQDSLWLRTRTLLERSTDTLPYAVVAAAALSLACPASFAWFTPNMIAPGLGFLMFAVGINLTPESFTKVLPQHIAIGTVAQWVIKPALGVLTASTLVPLLSLPSAIGAGLILVSCVSGAQLSNYATYLVHPEQAPLSIVLTALSTLFGAVITPALVLLLLGRRVPVNAPQMALSITQVVIAPVALGLLCNQYLPKLVKNAKPFIVFSSLLDTCACVGTSLSSNAEAARSLIGLQVLVPVVAFHSVAFILGHAFARRTVAHDSEPLARCISLETGMQSSLLGLLLASRFFQDPLICLPCGISVIVMTLSGFALVLYWRRQDKEIVQASRRS